MEELQVYVTGCLCPFDNYLMVITAVILLSMLQVINLFSPVA